MAILANSPLTGLTKPLNLFHRCAYGFFFNKLLKNMGHPTFFSHIDTESHTVTTSTTHEYESEKPTIWQNPVASFTPQVCALAPPTQQRLSSKAGPRDKRTYYSETKKRHLSLLNWFNRLYKHHKINQTLKSMFMSFSIKELPKNEVRLRSNWLLLHCCFFASLFFSDTIYSSRILVKPPHRSQHMGGHVGVNPIEATILIAPLISPKKTHTKNIIDEVFYQ